MYCIYVSIHSFMDGSMHVGSHFQGLRSRSWGTSVVLFGTFRSHVQTVRQCVAGLGTAVSFWHFLPPCMARFGRV